MSTNCLKLTGLHISRHAVHTTKFVNPQNMTSDIGQHLPDCTALHPRRQPSSSHSVLGIRHYETGLKLQT